MRGYISNALERVMFAEGSIGYQVREAFGTLHVVKQSFDQLWDLIETVTIGKPSDLTGGRHCPVTSQLP